jgi:CRP/FNR family transcriptional regulator, cyclic AMP receptor protein
MTIGTTPAKATLRALLTRHAGRLGLTASAIEALVAQSQVTHWRAGQQIFAAEDAHDLANFLVAGAVKVICPGQRRFPVLVQMVRPGQFFGLASLFDRSRVRQFGAVAHVPALVAMMSQEVITNVVAGLPPGNALQLMAYSWRALSRLLYEKCLLLTMPLRDRLLHELEMLAHDFGEPHASGTLIDLPLTHTDLAQLVVGSRAKVSRCVAELRRAGAIELVGHRRLLLRRELGASSGRSVPAVPLGT